MAEAQPTRRKSEQDSACHSECRSSRQWLLNLVLHWSSPWQHSSTPSHVWPMPMQMASMEETGQASEAAQAAEAAYSLELSGASPTASCRLSGLVAGGAAAKAEGLPTCSSFYTSKLPSSPTKHHSDSRQRCCLSAVRNHPAFSFYVCVSLSLLIVLLLDPLFNSPSGLITPGLITGKSSGYGDAQQCGFDYEGSWQIGLIRGASPLSLQVSNTSVISCATIGNRTAASYVAEPSLVIPAPDGNTGPAPNSPWYAFYQVKNLAHGKGEIGVARSTDMGHTWQHLGIALTAKHSLSSPWVTYDEGSGQYVMIPDTHKAHSQAVQLYVTSKQEFPFGWELLKSSVRGEQFMDTTAVHYQGQWWIFTTVKEQFRWGDRSYSLRLYHTPDLTGKWTEHPMSPITRDLRYARGGGRTFVYDGHVYRWTQDDSDYFGESLHLFKATVLDNSTYMEAYVQTLEPSGNGNWYSARTHHVDVQPVGLGGTWFGLVDGDQFKDGKHHFYQHEAAFVRLKHNLLKYNVLQLLLVCFVYLLLHTSGRLMGWISRTACFRAACKGQTGVCRMWFTFCRWVIWAVPELQLVGLMTVAIVATLLVFSVLPQLFWCPRALVKVDVIPTPPVKHQDPVAPYDISDLVIVTGATASFFDRMENMVGSVHTWEPHQRIIIYDLGFSQSQLAKMMCWENVEVKRFPYDKYPLHVKDVRNYAFKPLILQDALETHKAVLWIDSGLELRTDMTTMKSWMVQHGHVSAMQEDNIGDPMYTYTRNMVDYFGLSEQWPTVKKWQFCAGGLQGFVRNSDADRLVLQPVVNCSLHLDCIAPPGSSRKNHNFDQTALTIMIWHNNFSCLPRETHCMWSVKKASRAPLQTSEPIEVISRGHRLPKPYSSYVRSRQRCVPDKSKVPWSAKGLEHQESLSRYNLGFRISRIYMQPIGDCSVQCFSCLGAHMAMLSVFWALLGLVGVGCVCDALGFVWRTQKRRLALHLLLGSLVLATTQLGGFFLVSHIR